MARFFVRSSLAGVSQVTLDAKESRHAIKVLRLRPGDVVDLFDPAGLAARGIIAGADPAGIVVSIDASGQARFADADGGPALDIGISLIKPERMEWALQKAAELGARRIWPIAAERSIVRLPAARRQSKLERWRKIALESCKQCGRRVPPQIEDVRTVDELVGRFGDYGTVLLPTLHEKARPITDALASRTKPAVLSLIGPEGDFTPGEVRRAVEAGARPVSLGPLVLRSETAGLYVLAALNFYFREADHASA